MKETAKSKRLLNFVIDITVIAILMEITFRLENTLEYKTPIKTLRVIIVLGGYYIPMEYFFGKTVGKFITKSKVVNRDGTRISIKTSIIRYLCRWIPFEFISLALGNDAKAWHDVISETVVINQR